MNRVFWSQRSILIWKDDPNYSIHQDLVEPDLWRIHDDLERTISDPMELKLALDIIETQEITKAKAAVADYIAELTVFLEGKGSNLDDLQEKVEIHLEGKANPKDETVKEAALEEAANVKGP